MKTISLIISLVLFLVLSFSFLPSESIAALSKKAECKKLKTDLARAAANHAGAQKYLADTIILTKDRRGQAIAYGKRAKRINNKIDKMEMVLKNSLASKSDREKAVRRIKHLIPKLRVVSARLKRSLRELRSATSLLRYATKTARINRSILNIRKRALRAAGCKL